MSFFVMDTPQPESKVDFQKEIFNMMHAFGDNPNPNPASVILVESIVYQQIRSMIFKAQARADVRKYKTITHSDIIFLYRNNLTKLRRMYKYFLHYELVKKCSNTNATNVTEFQEKERDITKEIRSFDEFGELDDPVDDWIEVMRKKRAAFMTEHLSIEKYKAYHLARCYSFRTSMTNYTKFASWINPQNQFDISAKAIMILCHLAFETVAEIVDLVYLIRQDAKKKSDDPFVQFTAGSFCNPMSLNNAVYVKNGYEGVVPITTGEIREALRRYNCGRIGIDGLFYRNMSAKARMKYLAI